ncbi:hypothetical protein ENBRE01_0327 [Enteropsectra breve]|nr:hypothetical protein ENBRE01_0327 [Enteropsectra breve]
MRWAILKFAILHASMAQNPGSTAEPKEKEADPRVDGDKPAFSRKHSIRKMFGKLPFINRHPDNSETKHLPTELAASQSESALARKKSWTSMGNSTSSGSSFESSKSSPSISGASPFRPISHDFSLDSLKEESPECSTKSYSVNSTEKKTKRKGLSDADTIDSGEVLNLNETVGSDIEDEEGPEEFTESTGNPLCLLPNDENMQFVNVAITALLLLPKFREFLESNQSVIEEPAKSVLLQLRQIVADSQEKQTPERDRKLSASVTKVLNQVTRQTLPATEDGFREAAVCSFMTQLTLTLAKAPVLEKFFSIKITRNCFCSVTSGYKEYPETFIETVDCSITNKHTIKSIENAHSKFVKGDKMRHDSCLICDVPHNRCYNEQFIKEQPEYLIFKIKRMTNAGGQKKGVYYDNLVKVDEEIDDLLKYENCKYRRICAVLCKYNEVTGKSHFYIINWKNTKKYKIDGTIKTRVLSDSNNEKILRVTVVMAIYERVVYQQIKD